MGLFMTLHSFARHLLCVLLCLPVLAVAGTPVFINELHYDNAGTDQNEKVEVAGPVGTDLTGWSIALYNGSNGRVYDSIDLSGSIPANCAGMAAGVVVGVPPLGQIQNGGPDGLALVDGASTVVQFLSYEGSFSATDGPANGMTSTDIGVSEEGGTTAGESMQLSGTGTDYEDFAWNAPGTASFGSCNPGQIFGIPVDIPPAVASTEPANAATGVALASNVLIHFSETVTTVPGWADLVCANSGTHTLAISGSRADYTLDPDSDFDNAEACTVTIHAASVSDVDGASDPMVADYGFAFQTVADNPPQVISITPADNTATFPMAANLSVSFSEPVSLDSGWYALSCDNSGVHTAVQGGGDTSFTLNPDVDFDSLESCIFTIIASAVHDQDGQIDQMPADVLVHFTIAANDGDYYAGVDTRSGPVLKAWLHNRIKDHTAYPYSGSGTNTWVVLNVADQDPNNPNHILDLYKNQSLAKITGGQGAYNREHTWPNSLGFPNASRNSKPNPPYTDAHMLHLTDVDYNSKRGNKPLAECPPGTCARLGTVSNDGYGGTQGDEDANWYQTPDGNAGSFEIWGHRKGDIARAVLYMAVRYEGGIDSDGIVEPDLELTNVRSKIVRLDAQTGNGQLAYMGLLDDLLAWNNIDPPDAGEQLRNDVVYSYQQNRNPFIDHPEWAECVFKNQNCAANDNDIIFQDGFESVGAARGVR